MEGYTLEYLITDVNKIAKRPDPQELYLVVRESVKSVFMDIGIELLCDYQSNKIETIKDGRVRLGKDILLVDKVTDDRGLTGLETNGATVGSAFAKANVFSFKQTPFELIFGEDKKGRVKLAYYAFYLDENGACIIPSAAYKACKSMAIYECLDIANRDHPYWADRLIYRSDAQTETFKARGHLNKTTSARRSTTQRFY